MIRHAGRIWNFVLQNSGFLIVGAVVALIWANLHYDSYHALHSLVLWEDSFVGHLHDGYRTLTFHYLVNDLLMALFFFIAGKEVWEAIALKQGSLRGRKAFTPLVATAGGVIGPICVYLILALFMGSETYNAVVNGWAIPTATDIAFSYLVGRFIFGAGHPAVRFLLLLAIADDAVGLLILAIFYPTGEIYFAWIGVSIVAVILAYLCNFIPRMLDGKDSMRPYSTWMRKNLHCIPYVIAGCVSWFAFQESGIHPALGLLPIIPAIPHADHDYGFFAEEEEQLDDILNVLEHALKFPVECILFLFALMNAGVLITGFGDVTWLVCAGLLVGKPVGVFLAGYGASKLFDLPEGMTLRDLLVLGFVAAIGFTVALFVSTVAFPPGAVQDAAKLGALISLVAVIPAYLLGRFSGVQKVISSVKSVHA